MRITVALRKGDRDEINYPSVPPFFFSVSSLDILYLSLPSFLWSSPVLVGENIGCPRKQGAKQEDRGSPVRFCYEDQLVLLLVSVWGIHSRWRICCQPNLRCSEAESRKDPEILQPFYHQKTGCSLGGKSTTQHKSYFEELLSFLFILPTFRAAGLKLCHLKGEVYINAICVNISQGKMEITPGKEVGCQFVGLICLSL